MTFTYQTSGIGNSTLFQVRRLIGDTDATRQLLQDEEITWVLDNQASPTLAAAACCDLLAAQYAFLVNTENSELRLSAAARHKHYLDLADRLRAGGAGTIPGDSTIVLAEMYVGGQSIAAKQALTANSDNRAPDFAIGQDDNPEVAGGINYDVTANDD